MGGIPCCFLRGILLLLLSVSLARSASVDERQQQQGSSSASSLSLDSPPLLDTVRHLLAEIENLKSAMGQQEQKIIEQEKKLAVQAKKIESLSASTPGKATSPEIPRKRRSSSDDSFDSLLISILENAVSEADPSSSDDEEGVSKNQATDDALEKRITEQMQQLIDAAEKRFKQDFEAFKYEIRADDMSKFSQNSAMKTAESAVQAVNEELDEMLRKQLASQVEEKFQHLLQTELKDNVEEKIRIGFEKWEEHHRMTSTNPARTCSELMEFNPILASGTYLIDPDGWNTGDPPIQVRCEKSGDTIVAHDSLEKTIVEQCSEAGCYSRSVNYNNATLRQLRALTQLSSTCSQSIRYDCYVAPIAFCDTNYAWWSDVSGNPQYYWTGNPSITSNNSSNHTCSCGLTGTCFDSKLRCNCDASAATSLFDEGTLNNKDHLPVTRLHFGRLLSSNSSGEHTLGPLRCSGASSDNNNEKPASSCADLWRSGQLSTGLYHVQLNNGTVAALHCNMTKLPDEIGFETLIGHVYIMPVADGKSQQSPSKAPSSCADLRRAGQSISGLYQVLSNNGGSKVSTVLCDMSKQTDDSGFQTFVGVNDIKSSLVHFSVSRTNFYYRDSNNILTYEHAEFNLGNAINMNTGVFTAPKAGVYSFAYSLVSNNNGHGWSCIQHNGKCVTTSRVYSSNSNNNPNAHAIIKLAVGDEVVVHSEHSVRSVNFSGSLLVELFETQVATLSLEL